MLSAATERPDSNCYNPKPLDLVENTSSAKQGIMKLEIVQTPPAQQLGTARPREG